MVPGRSAKRSRRGRTLAVLTMSLVVLLGGGSAVAFAAPPPSVAPFMTQYCVDCHDADMKEGGLDLTSLGSDLTDAGLQARWVRIHDRVRDGEMPPQDGDLPSDADRKAFLNELAADLGAAHAKSKGTVLRRLNRHEYERTLNALLGTHVQVADLLPADGRAHGFDNIGEALDLSPVQIQRYMEAAAIALDACVSFGPKPEPQVQSLTFDTGRNAANIGKSWIKRPDGAVAVVTECCSPVKVYELRIRHTADYRVKLHISAHQSEQPVVYRVHAGQDFFDSMPLYGVFEAPPGKAAVNEFQVLLRPNETIRLWPELPQYWLKDSDIPDYEGPGIALHRLEVEGPLVGQWPLRGHKLRFGDIPAEDIGPEHQRDKPWYRPNYRLVSSDPAGDLARVLPPFLQAAFRRPVTAEIAAPFVAIGQAELAAGASLEQALRTAQTAALCSPDFLFLLEPEDRLDDYAVAARLSYMLWGLPPDAELLSLAAKKQLTTAERSDDELRLQTERLLADQRSGQFIRQFTDQWLNLREIDFTTPDKQLYPEYDALLQHAMLEETRLFFTEVLRKNLPVTEFLHSDWTFLNERLAEHYCIDGVKGVAMRRVSLKPEHHRGGVLTHASVLKVSANGTTTSPVKRGAIVLDRILGIEPPPPPPGVPGVEPDIRGATTLREQLAKHRSLTTCNSCHRVIDPPGFALENYDVIGGWRENYRSLGKDFPKPPAELTGGRNVAWRVGPPVDASGETPDGRVFSNLAEYKQTLLLEPEPFTRALVEKMAVYATGRAMGFSDRPELEQITQVVAAKGHGFRDLIHEVVQSNLFRNN
ncbi:MAG: DUF1592 domain-containing protein [Planctomycetes bacterium]|nr:DUF1592 domain-containing protein [Planctomycetota bacterium]